MEAFKRNTTINVLCGLIILILAASVCLPVYRFSVAFGYGLSAGFEEDGNRNEEEISIPVNVVFEPTLKSYAAPSDSIEVSGKERYPMLLTQGVVMAPSDRMPVGAYAVSLMCSLCAIGITFALIIAFIRFIVSVNRGQIFDSTNVVRLARIGWMLIAAGLLEVCSGISQTFLVGAIGFVSVGYMLKASWLPPFSEMLLGLFALMLAAIWKRGLAMQKEQELTI